MIQKIKTHLLILATALMAFAPTVALPVAAHAIENCKSNIADQVGTGASQASGNPGSVSCAGKGVDESSIGDLATGIVNIFSAIVGAVAIIMIIYGGFRYITSGGDSGSVGNAKNTLIYAIVGLIIVALAQIIVRFVLFQSDKATQI